MTHVFMEREYDPGLTIADFWEQVTTSANCFQMHGVHWHGSLLALGGRRTLCHFSSPDLESVRIAIRQSGGPAERMWPGTVHEGPKPPAKKPGYALVVVTRSWEEPVEMADIQAIEDASAGCLEANDVKFMHTFFSLDRRRMACLYRAPDAESVRRAQAQARMPVERVWACEALAPA